MLQYYYDEKYILPTEYSDTSEMHVRERRIMHLYPNETFVDNVNFSDSIFRSSMKGTYSSPS